MWPGTAGTSLYAGGWGSCGCAAHVLPDGCVDVMWMGGDVVVAGPARRAVRVPDGDPVFGVRLRIGAVEAALGVPACELTDLHVPLADLTRTPARSRLEAASRHGLRAGLAELQAQLSRLQTAPTADPLVREAARRLSVTGARVGTVARDVGLSERQLRRRFDRAVGYGPRTLAGVTRLQRLVRAYEGQPARGLSDLALTAGYADQPHMSREVRRLTGATPSELLVAGVRPAGERAGSFKTCGSSKHTIAS